MFQFPKLPFEFYTRNEHFCYCFVLNSNVTHKKYWCWCLLQHFLILTAASEFWGIFFFNSVVLYFIVAHIWFAVCTYVYTLFCSVSHSKELCGVSSSPCGFPSSPSPKFAQRLPGGILFIGIYRKLQVCWTQQNSKFSNITLLLASQ